MKREGRQHGMVRTYRVLPSPWNPRSQSRRYPQQFDSPPAAGLFAKVPVKPTNHSKFTGRCGRPRCLGCHMHPACKSKDKTKGTHKLRSCDDMVTNYRLITWRVVDGQHGFKLSGFSASGILDHLSSDYDDHDYMNDDHDHDYDEEDEGNYMMNDGLKMYSQSPEDQIIETNEDEIEEYDDQSEGVYVVDDDDYDDVKYVLDQDLGDEGWCLVGEI